jgi:hypothetical protein
MYVAICFIWMLQKLIGDVAHVASISEACCKCFRGVVQNVSSVPNVCCKRSNLDVAYVSHICCNNQVVRLMVFSADKQADVVLL